VVAAGQVPDAVLGLDQLVASDDCAVAVTGVTGCALLRAPRGHGAAWTTESIGMASGRAVLRVDTHQLLRLPERSPTCLTS